MNLPKEKTSRTPLEVLAMALIVWSVTSMVGDQISVAYALKDGLTEMADAYSEANSIRAGEGYAANGLTSNAGLPEVSYGSRFDRSGGKYNRLLCESSVHCIYKHSPPGPDLMLGVLTKWLGSGRIFLFRLFPIAFGGLCFCFVAACMVATLGLLRAAVLMFLLARVPMTSNMLHCLSLHGYALSLAMTEVAVLIFAFRQRELKAWPIVASAVIAFLAGWVTMDYIAPVTCAPLAVGMMDGGVFDRKKIRRILWLLLATGGGYALAFGLHFWQVAAYFNSARDAMADYVNAAHRRREGETWVVLPANGTFGMILYYWFDLLPKKVFFDGNFFATVAAIAALLAPWPTKRPIVLRGVGSLQIGASWWQLAAFFLMLVMSMAWMLVMQQHSGIHGHFVPRHHLLALFFGYYLVLRSVHVIGRSAAPAGATTDDATTSPPLPAEM